MPTAVPSAVRTSAAAHEFGSPAAAAASDFGESPATSRRRRYSSTDGTSSKRSYPLGRAIPMTLATAVASFRRMYPQPIERLVTELSKLPGIGRRTAQRLAFHILRSEDADAIGLADAIREVREKVGLCELCFNLAEGPRCAVCEDTRRDRSLICVVEQPADVIPIERTHEYRGLYHVLGGALSPIDGVDPDDLRISELVERIGTAR